MTPRRLFLAGPGPDLEPFTDAAKALQAASYDVPAYEAETGFYVYFDRRMDLMWHHLACHDLAQCDGVALLDGWAESPGAMLEVGFAMGRGIRCRPLSCWLNHRGVDPCECPGDPYGMALGVA